MSRAFLLLALIGLITFPAGGWLLGLGVALAILAGVARLLTGQHWLL